MAYPGVALCSLNGINRTTVKGGGFLSVTPPGLAILSDSFDGTTIDTVYRWNSPVLAGAGAVTQNNGLLALTTGTGASAAAALSSQEAFVAQGESFITSGAAMFIETTPSTNTHRFMGQGLPNASYTAATPLQDAAGWEYDITGSLNACIYAGNSRIFSQSFPISQAFPQLLAGAPALFAVSFRADLAYFYLNNFEEPVATAQIKNPNISTLPYRVHMINHTSGPAVAPTWTSTQVVVLDSAGNYPLLYNGQVVQRARAPGKFISVNALSIATETTVWTPASGRRFRLMGYQLSSTGAQNIVLKDNTAGTTILVIPGITIGQLNFSPAMGNGILSVAANNVLTANAGGTNAISGFFFGTEE